MILFSAFFFFQGKQGVSDVLNILTEELKTAMIVAGCVFLSSVIVKEGFFRGEVKEFK